MKRASNIFVLVLWVTSLATPLMSFDGDSCEQACCDVAPVSCPMGSNGGCSASEATMPNQQVPSTLVEISSTKVIMTVAFAMPVANAIVLDSPKTTILAAHMCLAAAHTLPLLI